MKNMTVEIYCISYIFVAFNIILNKEEKNKMKKINEVSSQTSRHARNKMNLTRHKKKKERFSYYTRSLTKLVPRSFYCDCKVSVKRKIANTSTKGRENE